MKARYFPLIAMLIPLTASAAPRYVTNWLFKATYDSGEFMEFTNTSEEEAVIPWVGSTWTCRKEAVSYSSNKAYVGGFSCRNNKGSFVTIYASCSSTKASVDSNRASVGDGSGYISFMSICATTEVTVPTKGTDRHL